MEAIQVIHANSNTLSRAGLKILLEQSGQNITYSGVENEEQLLNRLTNNSPDLVIIDYDQPGHFAESTIRNVRETHPNLKILLTTTDRFNARIMSVLENDIQGYLTRECDEGEVLSAVFSIARGEKFYCNKVMSIIMGEHQQPQDQDDCSPTSLTERETEIIRHIASGLINKEIAAKLDLSTHTVNTHRKNIMKKLNIGTASGLTMYAVKFGLVSPEEA